MRGFFSLPDQITIELQPRAFFIHDAIGDADFENTAFLVDTVIVDNVEFGLDERRRDFVFHDLDADVIAGGVASIVLERFLAADVKPHARVKFQRLAAGRRFGTAEHDADFFAQLIRENARRFGLGENGGELAKRLAHQPCLHAHRRHAHVAFEFGLGHERGDGINHDNVERVRARERFANSQCFFAGRGLRDEQVVQVHAKFFCVTGIERVLGVNERCEAAGFFARWR